MIGEIRRLSGPEDFKECFKIIEGKKKIGGTESPDMQSLLYSYDKYFSTNMLVPMHTAIGYIENDKIISFMLIAHLQNKSRGKFWVMPALYTSRPHNIFSFNNPEIGLLIKWAFEHAERMGFYEYYYTIAEHISEVYERQINKTKYIPLHRYERVDLAVVPKDTVSDVDLYAKLLGYPKPHNMIIKKRILKEEFRLNTDIKDTVL